MQIREVQESLMHAGNATLHTYATRDIRLLYERTNKDIYIYIYVYLIINFTLNFIFNNVILLISPGFDLDLYEMMFFQEKNR